MDTLEEKALAVASKPATLRKRLNETRSCLKAQYRAHFRPGVLDHKRKRLVSDSGRYFLQWTTRRNPDAPVSYENQQTSIGFVALLEIKQPSPV